MRDIKFRGKRLDNGGWVYGDFTRRKSRYAPQLDTTYGISDEFGTFRAVDQSTVGQFTGLCDKDGREIYEGDIIVGTYKDMGTDTGLVVFKGCGFKVEIPNVGDDELVDWERYSDSIEVIGNIYENPELLEGKRCDTNQ